MFPPKAKIKAEISHSFLIALVAVILTRATKQVVKIIQSFANEKIIFLMVTSLYKWFIFPCFLFLSQPSQLKKILLTNGSNHPYYVSVVEINHNATDKTLEISCKIFTNDFEETLEKNYKTRVDLVNPADKAAMDKLVSDYIKKHLSLQVDSKQVNFSYVGFEKEDEAIYSYFQIDNVASLKKLNVVNSILHDFSDQQINIVHCIVGGKRQSTKLDYPKTDASFQF
jgi:hypothetical protein